MIKMSDENIVCGVCIRLAKYPEKIKPKKPGTGILAGKEQPETEKHKRQPNPGSKNTAAKWDRCHQDGAFSYYQNHAQQ